MSPPYHPPQRDDPSNGDIMRAVERLTDHVTGGAAPEKGLIVRMDRLEQAQAAQRRWGLAAIGGGGMGILGAVKAWLLTGGNPPAPHV